MFRERATAAGRASVTKQQWEPEPLQGRAYVGGIEAPAAVCGVPHRRSLKKSSRHPTPMQRVPVVTCAPFGAFPAALNIAELQL